MYVLCVCACVRACMYEEEEEEIHCTGVMLLQIS